MTEIQTEALVQDFQKCQTAPLIAKTKVELFLFHIENFLYYANRPLKLIEKVILSTGVQFERFSSIEIFLTITLKSSMKEFLEDLLESLYVQGYIELLGDFSPEIFNNNLIRIKNEIYSVPTDELNQIQDSEEIKTLKFSNKEILEEIDAHLKNPQFHRQYAITEKGRLCLRSNEIQFFQEGDLNLGLLLFNNKSYIPIILPQDYTIINSSPLAEQYYSFVAKVLSDEKLLHFEESVQIEKFSPNTQITFSKQPLTLCWEMKDAKISRISFFEKSNVRKLNLDKIIKKNEDIFRIFTADELYNAILSKIIPSETEALVLPGKNISLEGRLLSIQILSENQLEYVRQMHKAAYLLQKMEQNFQIQLNNLKLTIDLVLKVVPDPDFNILMQYCYDLLLFTDISVQNHFISQISLQNSIHNISTYFQALDSKIAINEERLAQKIQKKLIDINQILILEDFIFQDLKDQTSSRLIRKSNTIIKPVQNNFEVLVACTLNDLNYIQKYPSFFSVMRTFTVEHHFTQLDGTEGQLLQLNGNYRANFLPENSIEVQLLALAIELSQQLDPDEDFITYSSLKQDITLILEKWKRLATQFGFQMEPLPVLDTPPYLRENLFLPFFQELVSLRPKIRIMEKEVELNIRRYIEDLEKQSPNFQNCFKFLSVQVLSDKDLLTEVSFEINGNFLQAITGKEFDPTLSVKNGIFMACLANTAEIVINYPNIHSGLTIRLQRKFNASYVTTTLPFNAPWYLNLFLFRLKFYGANLSISHQDLQTHFRNYCDEIARIENNSTTSGESLFNTIDLQIIENLFKDVTKGSILEEEIASLLSQTQNLTLKPEDILILPKDPREKDVETNNKFALILSEDNFDRLADHFGDSLLNLDFLPIHTKGKKPFQMCILPPFSSSDSKIIIRLIAEKLVPLKNQGQLFFSKIETENRCIEIVDHLNAFFSSLNFAGSNPFNGKTIWGSVQKYAPFAAKVTWIEDLMTKTLVDAERDHFQGDISPTQIRIIDAEHAGILISSKQLDKLSSFSSVEHIFSKQERTLQMSNPTQVKMVYSFIPQTDTFSIAKFLGLRSLWDFLISRKTSPDSVEYTSTIREINEQSFKTQIKDQDPFLSELKSQFVGYKSFNLSKLLSDKNAITNILKACKDLLLGFSNSTPISTLAMDEWHKADSKDQDKLTPARISKDIKEPANITAKTTIESQVQHENLPFYDAFKQACESDLNHYEIVLANNVRNTLADIAPAFRDSEYAKHGQFIAFLHLYEEKSLIELKRPKSGRIEIKWK